MERHPAHRYAAIRSRRLPRQRQLQLMRCRQCIVIEKLIEIAQTVKKQTVPVFLFDFLILCHQGRFGHGLFAPFFRKT